MSKPECLIDDIRMIINDQEPDGAMLIGIAVQLWIEIHSLEELLVELKLQRIPHGVVDKRLVVRIEGLTLRIPLPPRGSHVSDQEKD